MAYDDIKLSLLTPHLRAVDFFRFPRFLFLLIAILSLGIVKLYFSELMNLNIHRKVLNVVFN